jgi:hypothetical protein
MHAARKDGLLSSFIGILARLYLLSGAAVVTVLLGNILGFLSSATYTHQVLGAMIVTGGVWFLALSINAIMFAEPRDQSEVELFSGSSTGATSTNPDPKSQWNDRWTNFPRPKYIRNRGRSIKNGASSVRSK